MTPIYDCPDAVAAFVARGIFSEGREFGACTALGFATEAEGLVAGFVFHNYEPENGVIEVSGYSTRRDWVNHAHLKTLFEYPFDQLGCRMVVARHSERNKRVIRIWAALGAKQITLPELRGPNEAEVVALLKAEDWKSSKFMRQTNG